MPNLMTHDDALSIANKLLKVPRTREEDMAVIEAANGLLPVAVTDARLSFPNDGSEPYDTYLKRKRTASVEDEGKPHWFPHVEPGDDRVDLVLERAGFGSAASPAGRARLYRAYGEELFERRRLMWGASKGTIQSGTEPGVDSKAVVEQATRIVADQDSNSPFNPAKRFLTGETRENECIKYIKRFGTEAVRGQCVKFNCDISGRPLRTKT
jgi:hypothetical protein